MCGWQSKLLNMAESIRNWVMVIVMVTVIIYLFMPIDTNIHTLQTYIHYEHIHITNIYTLHIHTFIHTFFAYLFIYLFIYLFCTIH